MRPVVKSVTGLAASATSIAAATTLGAAGEIPQNGALATTNGVVAAQTTAGAGFLVLNGSKAFSGTVQLANPSNLNISSTGNLSGVNFTIVGTVAQGPDTTGNTGGPQTEVIAGPNNGTVVTQNTFIAIKSIAVSAAVGTNVTVYATATEANPSQVSLTSASDNSAVTFTVYGFNASGQPLTETLLGPGAGATVLTQNYWSAVTQVSASAAITAVSVGNSASAATPWIVVDYLQEPFNVGLQVTLSGTVNYSVQATADDPFGSPPNFATPTLNAFFVPVMPLVGANTPQLANLTVPCRAVRLITNSGTGTATITAVQGINP